ncbi:MAG: Zn-ribbon domain-containing OB-fold protein [Candidatus Bipolaricaulota bacterium]|nr:Zn-ribbon domain-containing OB-fold protein [Candidatus Bipolaricaulota bacterium]MCS7274827.1 Zn-ribbon domain-containing OB-fold protein [Candidatus Bipolaricaulota bacterium]MDW8111248.1 Zn-ribbon domain-containing OB-fold protein [Candidatus Bipolaricaulota bacterium]MDW8328616.1 Zn-ribbon domain-containing OB-fold protein [Candidatus Bipolaricaulota bacterium]
MLERIEKSSEIRHWIGDMEADHYYYSAGIAGEKFFVALRDEGKIVGAHCATCNLTYVPPRIYCERCFAELTEHKDMGKRGCVVAFTVAHYDKAGQRLDPPESFALISLGPRTTPLLHKLGEIAPEKICVGLEVEAVLKPQREGKITDILYFKPVK